MKRAKKYNEVTKKISNKILDIDSAIKLVKDLSITKFDSKVEVHVSLNLNDKERKQPIRGTVIYDKPIGKSKKILVFGDESTSDKAKKSGADYYGLEDLINKIKEGWIDFDVAIATPSVMPKIAVLGRILGTKGLMPNPKNGTVTDNIEEVVKSYKKGRQDYKSDETGVIHSVIGTISMSEKELKNNFELLLKSIIISSGKSSTLLIKSLFICPTMGPSIKINKDLLNKEL